jgi:hypothetical protein
MSLLGRGQNQCDGAYQKTRSLDLVGASLDLQIGWQPPSGTDYNEMSIGLGKHLGVGFFYGNPDFWGYQSGGIALHFGLGLGLPLNITSNYGPSIPLPR